MNKNCFSKFLYLKQEQVASLFALALFAISIFVYSHQFVTITIPANYLSLLACGGWGLVILLYKFRTKDLRISQSETVLGGLLGLVLLVGLYYQSISLSFVVSGISLLLFYFAIRRTKWDWKILSVGLSSFGIIESVYAIGQYVHWFANTKMYAVPCGSFNNPAGLAITLVAVLPFAFGLFCKKSWLWRIFGGITLSLLCAVIILSQSRAGMVAAFVIVLIFFIHRFSFLRMRYWQKWLRITVIIAFCSTLIGGLYFLKKDSADGRLLIWQCSAQMIADKPILGHGAGGFQREYMRSIRQIISGIIPTVAL